MARPWESALQLEPTTLPYSSSNMSSRLCSKGSSGTSLVCCSVPASLSASGRGGCCSGSSILICSYCTGSSSLLPFGSRCSSSVPGSCPSPMSLSPVSTGWVATTSSVVLAALGRRSSEIAVVSSLVAIGGSSSSIACQGSSVSFVVSPAGRSSLLIVMGVFLPSASCY